MKQKNKAKAKASPHLRTTLSIALGIMAVAVAIPLYAQVTASTLRGEFNWGIFNFWSQQSSSVSPILPPVQEVINYGSEEASGGYFNMSNGQDDQGINLGNEEDEMASEGTMTSEDGANDCPDDAVEQLNTLNQQVEMLDSQKNDIEAQITALEQQKEGIENQLQQKNDQIDQLVMQCNASEVADRPTSGSTSSGPRQQSDCNAGEVFFVFGGQGGQGRCMPVTPAQTNNSPIFLDVDGSFRYRVIDALNPGRNLAGIAIFHKDDMNKEVRLRRVFKVDAATASVGIATLLDRTTYTVSFTDTGGAIKKYTVTITGLGDALYEDYVASSTPASASASTSAATTVTVANGTYKLKNVDWFDAAGNPVKSPNAPFSQLKYTGNGGIVSVPFVDETGGKVTVEEDGGIVKIDGVTAPGSLDNNTLELKFSFANQDATLYPNAKLVSDRVVILSVKYYIRKNSADTTPTLKAYWKTGSAGPELKVISNQ